MIEMIRKEDQYQGQAAATTGLGDCVENGVQNYDKILIVYLICFRMNNPYIFRFL